MVSNVDVKLVLSLLGAHEGKIEGRTRIQKEVCILKYRDKVPFDFSFKSYYYGPYSSELMGTISDLVGMKLIQETVVSTGYSSYRYDYELTHAGRKILDKINRTSNSFPHLSSSVRELEDLDLSDLVRLAKTQSGLRSTSA